MWSKFLNKIETIREERQSNIALLLNPRMEKLPLPITRIDDPFLPYGKEIINATKHLVTAYIFDLASYLSLGAAGAVALERTIRFAKRDNICILHAPFATDAYSAMADDIALGLDALTVTNLELMRTYLEKPPYAAFAVTNSQEIEVPNDGGYLVTSNSRFVYRNKSGEIQDLLLTDEAFLSQSQRDDYLAVLVQSLEQLR